jgi:hypothetical protein
MVIVKVHHEIVFLVEQQCKVALKINSNQI